MTRHAALAAVRDHFASGAFRETLARRIAIPSASRDVEHRADLEHYAVAELQPTFEGMGFAVSLGTEAAAPGPFLVARRIEDPAFTTVLLYGHGDVVTGLESQWSAGLSPWSLVEQDGRWYGRGTSDNKGQHSIAMAALQAVLTTRGHLGFNAIFLIEMGEESGSLGLDSFCRREKAALAADLLIASDGPRLSLNRPTLFLGARGGLSFHLTIEARQGFYHSGNWGGLLSNPGIELAHAIASLVGPRGQIRVPALVPPPISGSVRRALADCPIETGPDDPTIDPSWGEPGLTPAEQVFGWCSLEVMEFACGNLDRPLYAIPPSATARMQLRFPVGVDPDAVVPAVRTHLDRHGFSHVTVTASSDAMFLASRLDPDHPWVGRIAGSVATTMGSPPAILPNLGGSLPNNIFADDLGLPTVWIPHSYPGCRQHGADEHVPVSIVREGLDIMTGVFWDLGEPGFADSTDRA